MSLLYGPDDSYLELESTYPGDLILPSATNGNVGDNCNSTDRFFLEDWLYVQYPDSTYREVVRCLLKSIGISADGNQNSFLKDHATNVYKVLEYDDNRNPVEVPDIEITWFGLYSIHMYIHYEFES